MGILKVGYFFRFVFLNDLFSKFILYFTTNRFLCLHQINDKSILRLNKKLNDVQLKITRTYCCYAAANDDEEDDRVVVRENVILKIIFALDFKLEIMIFFFINIWKKWNYL